MLNLNKEKDLKTRYDKILVICKKSESFAKKILSALTLEILESLASTKK